MYNEEMSPFVVAISGASGSIYGIRLVRELLSTVDSIHLCISNQAFSIINTENDLHWAGDTDAETERTIRDYFGSDKVHYYGEQNLAAPFSSGSFLTGGMFIVPCSMKTLSAIASGYASNLIARAADVSLKQGRKLILSPREMPFNTIHLENMLKLSRMGATIAPPVPAFYQKPEKMDDIIDFVVGKILDSAGISHSLFQRWG